MSSERAGKVLFGVAFFALVRPCLTIAVLCATNGRGPPSVSWYLPLELCLYPLVVDLWFYSYHRACHELDTLWKFHRTHHLTKHPIPVLASYSDLEQEIIEVILVPIASYLTLKCAVGMPMHFFEWWICQAYILFEEVIGHSGLRIYAIAPSIISPILCYLGCELVIEDHDLHHRRGWRQSYNYGKQTRLWDRLLGTTAPRLESEEIDHHCQIDMPVF